MNTAYVAPTSRYAGLEIAYFTGPDGREIAYISRRLVPAPERFSATQEHVVADRERLDNLASRFFGDPELFWRLCDANRALRPEELETPPGRRLRITMPEGIPAPGGPID